MSNRVDATYQLLVCAAQGVPIITKNTSVILGDHFIGFIEGQIGTGRFSSASEVVRAGLRLLEEHEASLRTLQNALIAGEESGEPRVFDNDAFLARMHAKHAN